MTDICPHCKVLRGEFIGEGDLTIYSGRIHCCADSNKWTQVERDLRREEWRKWDPSIKFAPDRQWIAEHFGSRSARK